MKIATVCSGIGSPEVALKNLGIDHTITFACEIDKYARQTYLENHDCETMSQDMTAESWESEKYYADLMIGGIPCQSFSLAGKRLGELDPRGLLFFDFLRYVKNQQPKYFIIENVKGLLSDAGGETFQNWIHLLGQSVNGNAFFFPHEDSLMYNIHWQVLNTKDYGLPQNRERVFLVGIRNDLPNTFVFPKGVPLKLRLKDILEESVDEKYYLSDKMISYLQRGDNRAIGFTDLEKKSVANCVIAGYHKTPTDGEYLKVPSATKSGYEIANEGDSINLEHPNSETRHGRVGKQVAQTLTTSCNQGVMIGAMRGRNPENPNDRSKGGNYTQTLEINENGTSNCLSTVQKDNLVVYTGIAVHPISKKLEFDGFKDGNSPALLATDYKAPKCVQYSDYRIRKLTPREVFRLQGFPDEFLQNAIDAGVSNSQLYKQAGNSISVPVIEAVLKNLLKDYLPN